MNLYVFNLQNTKYFCEIDCMYNQKLLHRYFNKSEYLHTMMNLGPDHLQLTGTPKLFWY